MKGQRIIRTLFVITLPWVFFACKSPRITEPERSGIEQLLLSTAVDRALEQQDIPQVEGKKIFLSEDYMEAYDSRYVIGAIRAKLSESGAHLVEKREAADIIVEARSGALGIDSSSTLFGIPSIPVIIPAAGSLNMPGVALYKAERANAITKLALLAYEVEGEPVFSSESYAGSSHFNQYTVLFFFDINLTNIPERRNF